MAGTKLLPVKYVSLRRQAVMLQKRIKRPAPQVKPIDAVH